MPAHVYFVSYIVLLFYAFILSLLVTISLPNLPTLDIVRCHFTGGIAPRVSTGPESIKEIRFGIWGYCTYDAQTGDPTCIYRGHRYSTQLISASNSVIIESGSTRGLTVHLFSTGATFIAFLFSLSSHVTIALLASFITFFAGLITLIAFAIDIALYIIVRDKVLRLPDVQARTVAAPGFWITLASLLLLLIAGSTALLSRRRSCMAGTTNNLIQRSQSSFPSSVVIPECNYVARQADTSMTES